MANWSEPSSIPINGIAPKHALPLRRLTLSQEGLVALDQEMNARRMQPLGKLLPGYTDAFEIEPQEAKQQFLEWLRAFLEARNRLVHHLLDDPGLLMPIEACEACIARLGAEYRLAEAIALQVLNLHAFVLKRTLVKPKRSLITAKTCSTRRGLSTSSGCARSASSITPRCR